MIHITAQMRVLVAIEPAVERKGLYVVPRRLRKMKRQPEKGSADSFSRHNCARPSISFLRSTGSIATRIRMVAVTWIIFRFHARRAAGWSNRAVWLLSSESAS